MSDQPQLHPSIIAMISLASGIASRHPDMGLCQLERLRSAGIPEHQIDIVIEIARHIRDEAAQKLDVVFDEKAIIVDTIATDENSACCRSSTTEKKQSCGCTPTASGKNCC